MRQAYKVKVSGDDKLAIIEVQGDLTALSEESMEKAYQEAIGYNAQNMLLFFDVEGRIDSGAIGIVINVVIQNKKKGYNTFIGGLSQHFRKILDLVGLTKYVTIVNSRDEIPEL